MNPYYTKTFDVNPGSPGRSQAVEDEFQLIENAFDVVELTNDALLRVPEASVAPLPNVAARALKALAFDALGDPVVITYASTAQMQAALDAAAAAAASELAAAGSASAAAGSASAAACSASAAAGSALDAASAAGSYAPTIVLVSGTSQAAAAGGHYVLTNAAATTVTGPASPNAGDTFFIAPANGRLDNVFDPNGLKVKGQTGSRTLDMGLATYQLRYMGATDGWWLL